MNKTGHSLNTPNDLFLEGFGVYEYAEPVKIVWTNFSESRKKLGDKIIDTLLEIIAGHDHIQFEIAD